MHEEELESSYKRQTTRPLAHAQAIRLKNG